MTKDRESSIGQSGKPENPKGENLPSREHLRLAVSNAIAEPFIPFAGLRRKSLPDDTNHSPQEEVFTKTVWSTVTGLSYDNTLEGRAELRRDEARMLRGGKPKRMTDSITDNT